MTVNDAITFINGVGFPIFACIAMGLYIVWDRKLKNQERTENNTVIEQLVETVNANTIAVEELRKAISTKQGE